MGEVKPNHTTEPMAVYSVGGGVGPITAYEVMTYGGKTVATYDLSTNENANADANLGVLAPELLAIVKDAFENVDFSTVSGRKGRDLYLRMEAALAKMGPRGSRYTCPQCRGSCFDKQEPGRKCQGCRGRGFVVTL